MTDLQRKILKALLAGYVMYRYPANNPTGIIVCKGNYNIDPDAVQQLVDQGYLTSRIDGGEKLYSLTDKGRAEVAPIA